MNQDPPPLQSVSLSDEAGEFETVVESVTKLSDARQQNPTLELLMNNVPFGVLLLDSELRLIAANKAYSVYFDDTIDFAVGTPIEILLPQAQSSGIVPILRRALSRGRSVRVRNFRYDGFRKGVTYWNGSAIPIRLASDYGPHDAVAMVALEVTEEILAREQLASLAIVAERRASEVEINSARLNAIVESVPVALVVCDAGGKITSINSAARELYATTGMLQRLQPDMRLEDGVFTPDIIDDTGLLVPPGEMPIMRSLRGETCRDVVLHVPTPSSRRRLSLCVNSAPVRDSDGNISGAVQAISDITQQRLAQEQIEDNYAHEHAIATKLQESFAARDLPEIEGFAYEQAYHPARDSAIIGGDFYDVFRVGDDRSAVVMADVAGKGLNSAVYTAMSKYILRAYALEDCDPARVLARLNEALHACTPPELFVTLIYGLFDANNRTFTYANAGHEHPLLVRAAAGEVNPLEVTGPALALLKRSIYCKHQIEMDPGDILVLYTDGITDAGSGRNRLGQERLLELLRSAGETPLQEIVASIIGKAREFAGGTLADDAALLAIKAL